MQTTYHVCGQSWTMPLSHMDFTMWFPWLFCTFSHWTIASPKGTYIAYWGSLGLYVLWLQNMVQWTARQVNEGQPNAPWTVAYLCGSAWPCMHANCKCNTLHEYYNALHHAHKCTVNTDEMATGTANKSKIPLQYDNIDTKLYLVQCLCTFINLCTYPFHNLYACKSGNLNIVWSRLTACHLDCSCRLLKHLGGKTSDTAKNSNSEERIWSSAAFPLPW